VALPEVFQDPHAAAEGRREMTVFISLLRAVNVGGNNMIKMEALRELYATLRLRYATTYVQSGNVVFRAAETDSARLARRIEDGIERVFGHRPDVVIRTAAEMRDVVARNPFAARDGLEPSKLLVTFLASQPAEEVRAKVLALQTPPEELHVHSREIFTYFPNGISQAKLSMSAVDRALKIPGTGRNWNTVTKLLAMAEKLEG
jgi:uncharacterized protein (DUF1697 family)